MDDIQNKFKDSVIDNLLEMNTFYKLSINGIQRAKYESFGDPDLIPNIQKCMASALGLYKKLKPELKDVEKADDYSCLSALDDYENAMLDLEGGNLEMLFESFKIFISIIDSLNMLANELNYTKEEEIG